MKYKVIGNYITIDLNKELKSELYSDVDLYIIKQDLDFHRCLRIGVHSQLSLELHWGLSWEVDKAEF